MSMRESCTAHSLALQADLKRIPKMPLRAGKVEGKRGLRTVADADAMG